MGLESVSSQPSRTLDYREIAGASSSAKSPLSERAEVAKPAGSRVGVFGRIANFAKKLFGCSTPGPRTTTPRRPNLKQRQQDYCDQLSSVMSTLMSRRISSDTLAERLSCAHTASIALSTDSRASRAVLRTAIGQFLANANTSELSRIATAFGGKAVATTQESLAAEPGAAQILIEIETALNAELAKRTGTKVGAAMDAAVFALESGESPARIADHMHFALDSAGSLVQLGVVQPGDATAQSSVHAQILVNLDALPPHTRENLISHLSLGDLQTLQRAANASRSRSLTRVALNNEVIDRGNRLSMRFQTKAQELTKLGDGAGADRGRWIRDLSAVAGDFKALQQLRATFGVPDQIPIFAISAKQDLTAAAEKVLGSFDPKSVTTAEVTALTTAFNALGAPQIARAALGPIQDQLIAKDQAAATESVGDVLSVLVWKGDELAAHPGDLLRTLGAFEKSASALADTTNRFASPIEKSVVADAAVRPAIEKTVGALEPHVQRRLADVVQTPAFGKFMNGLRIAEQAARNAHDPAKADRFALMYQLAAGVMMQVGVTIDPPTPKEVHPSSLSEPMRKTLDSMFALNVEPNGWVASKSGHFNPQQAQALAGFLETPASDKERKLVQVGDHMVADQFVLDAKRGRPRISIVTADGKAQPAIDRTNWPKDEAAKDARVADGYAKLVEFCDGDEAQARELSYYLQQNLAAGVIGACMREDSPLKLDDGGPGFIRVNNEGGGGDQLDVALSKGANGRPQIDVSYRYQGRNTLIPVDGSPDTQLSPDSRGEFHYRAELVDGALKLVAPPSYGFAIKGDDFQKVYAPPTIAALRTTDERAEAVLDTIKYAATIGKAYQVNTIRAIDAFANAPTAMNAQSVLDELGSAEAEEKETVSTEMRQSIAAAARQSREGVLLAVNEAVQACAARLDAGGLDDSSRDEIHAFLEGAASLQQAGAAEFLPRATQLFRKYIERKDDEESARAAGQRPLGFDPETETKVRLALESAGQGAFDPALFSQLDQRLTHQLETTLLPGMIQAVRDGKL